MSAEEHGIDGGAYDNVARLATGHPVPALFCPCGFSTSPTCETWEEAGADLDQHLAEWADS